MAQSEPFFEEAECNERLSEICEDRAHAYHTNLASIVNLAFASCSISWFLSRAKVVMTNCRYCILPEVAFVQRFPYRVKEGRMFNDKV